MACASLAMYDMVGPVRQANDRLWHFVRSRLQESGIAVPDHLDRETAHDEAWLRRDLVLAHACGYPYVLGLRGKVRLVATPHYSFPGGEGANRLSYIVVSTASEFTDLASLRGTVAAINDPLSNSGMNLFRVAIAPLAADGRFFNRVLVTGSHLASLASVASGAASVAAVDTVTYGLLWRHSPERLAGIRVLAETPRGPGLPFVTRAGASDAEVGLLRASLAAAIAEPALALEEGLGLTGLSLLDDEDYGVLDRYRQQAEAMGYPAVA